MAQALANHHCRLCGVGQGIGTDGLSDSKIERLHAAPDRDVGPNA